MVGEQRRRALAGRVYADPIDGVFLLRNTFDLFGYGDLTFKSAGAAMRRLTSISMTSPHRAQSPDRTVFGEPGLGDAADRIRLLKR
jgi:hypothetical protein